ncbi:MAG: (E)-4-hydroxy-3-methylbut-2-enyl-diphosphate synthase [Rikenellaceae bacterium]|nr:(E)-4-hydroxy-3-methylbut-2-enyl-diphosphate synthase [Rikenellaceae bacterium]
MADFCNFLSDRRRIETLSVRIGDIFIGSGYPVRVQSMCNTDTNDTEACVKQAMEIADAGGELVRFTAQGIKEAENLKNIKEKLLAAGCTVPLVADIHFNPEAALTAAKYVDKIRINPGNFVDKRAVFQHIEYTDKEYSEELSRLRKKFESLLSVCKRHNTALRIGVNHGSLSDRIMSRYGNTPAGMVESAMEFLRICRDNEFYNVVISMKSSNVRVMVHAYRLLSATMRNERMKYPLHLGVTEAGNGEDGRVKSAVGIGALLTDGLGDTIRVSLTEHPANEIPVGRTLCDHFSKVPDQIEHKVEEKYYSPFEYKKRETLQNGIIGGDHPPIVITSGKNRNMEIMPDMFYDDTANNWLFMNLSELNSGTIDILRNDPQKIIVLETSHSNGTGEQRAFFLKLGEYGLKNPVIIKRQYSETDIEKLQIKASADIGILFLDGYGDGLWIENTINGAVKEEDIVSLSYSILQAARVRTSRTEYIACPGCGRTLFDLEGTLSEVKRRTSHLSGIKIAVMGCIVNGPGEMADADYGYVGAGSGKVTLYKNKEIIKKNIPETKAIDELLEFINKDK